MTRADAPFRPIRAPFVVQEATGVAVRDRLKDLTGQPRRAAVGADWQAGVVHVVRGGKRLANTRHHLVEAQLTEAQWRARWEAARWFLSADGETGKTCGNETIRVTPDGQVGLKLPTPWPTWPTPRTAGTS